ncbi:RluA family pseudouridine synthase [Sediminibacterium goheungense]|uniref:23S rRNA pseudouridine955/2504/2580 synthase/23S rRNA pseudouridine1911/1915/1917 synthase n=1 Tax=Sediminibacterium goheungense TaxID=1086393 RepID=A0A4R6IWU1_9BACT|nr:RluA family pseudouridine synthase [Sediminibacterium goheungense]TDO26831.1 23S rRNA pseudouridine955/2504/2580 synthase/23S rRNA pseudouridine1911/1915/1917 synthase [Sediminibacterium goheungense]
MRPDIIFENDFFVAVNKPSGLLSIPDRLGQELSLKDILKSRYENIYTVHRLDKDTSGIIVFAKNEESHKQLSQLFEGRDVEKFYLGLVHGKLINETGSIDASIMEHPGKTGKMITHVKGKASLTDYTVLESFRLYSWLQFQIHTGRTHQIRVHMQHLGHPIVCDELYGDPAPILLSALKKKFKLSKHDEEERPLMGRLALHSHKLSFSLNGEKFELEAELPKDLRAMLAQLRKLK